MTTRTFRFTVTSTPAASWVPTVGNLASVSLNTLNSQAPTLGGSQTNPAGVMDAWCGMTYAATLGANGSLVLHGGGHDDYPYNEVYRYDVATRLWSRIVEPVYPIFLGPDSYYTDATYAEYYTSTAGSAVHTGKAAADHTYGHTLWLPQGSLGSDAAGYYFSAGNSSQPPGGQRGSAWPHYVPLSAPSWTRGGAAFATGPSYGPALYDSARNRVVLLRSSDFNQSLSLFNCATQTAGTLSVGSPGTRTYYGTAAYDSAADLYMSANVGNVTSGATLQLINPTTGAMKYATLSADPLAGAPAGGWEWVQSWGAWVHYRGSGNVVHTLKKPADAWDGTWTFASQTLSGTALASNANPHYSRFRYVPSLDVFLWASTTANAVQAFRLAQP